MRKKITILILGLEINTVQSKEIILVLRGIEGLDNLILKTGLEYDSNIEFFEGDSEMVFSEFTFFVNGGIDYATNVINEVINSISFYHPFFKGGLCVTMTKSEWIHFFF